MRPRARGDSRGFALLVVLWTLVLVSLLVLQLTEAGGAQARLGANLRRAAISQAAADGVFAEAAFRLMDRSAAGWPTSGGDFTLPLPGGEAAVRVRNEAGRVDLNNASPQVLAGLIAAVGMDERQAAGLAEQIVAWHTAATDDQRRAVDAAYVSAQRTLLPPLSPFESVSELGLVLGMTPELLSKLMPHITVFQGGDPVASLADPVVRQVLAAAGGATLPAGQSLEATGNDVVRLRVSVRMGSARFVRSGVVQLEPGENQAAYRVLSWSWDGTDRS